MARESVQLISKARTQKSSLPSAACSMSALPLIATEHRTFREVGFVPLTEVLSRPRQHECCAATAHALLANLQCLAENSS